ncbi:MAG TPA: hypothetical protein VKB85_13005 [Propionibacteriaceae bacterium]|nr:hypothetical protein [Propionibacteriaceae bacterium]
MTSLAADIVELTLPMGGWWCAALPSSSDLDDSAAARAAPAWAAPHSRRTGSVLWAVNVLHRAIGMAALGRPAEHVVFS